MLVWVCSICPERTGQRPSQRGQTAEGCLAFQAAPAVARSQRHPGQDLERTEVSDMQLIPVREFPRGAVTPAGPFGAAKLRFSAVAVGRRDFRRGGGDGQPVAI